ncbi:TonB-dependent receptor [Hymenobacter sp. ASUV-10]|uniref:TonB-dependent receptor n=1 Tax=Hymenobacter aranciens TaxID=3063996 RepID=A0ABT9BM23_9BACT|nr:outer membrane beta-barrel protein [Hymenobacter sp. ASUV-10]MDO7877691.1 TonB-dependent receptor [Hymenobacter sp. ASUV-10]
MKSTSFIIRAVSGLAFLCALFLVAAAARAQGTGSVRGTLRDAKSGEPVPFSDVVLLRAADSTLVTGVQAAENGSFEATGLALGSYLLRVQDLNYALHRRRFTLTASAPAVQLGTLKMTATTTALGEVVVTGQQATVLESLDKKVINVEKDLGSVGGTAVNVLQNVPSVAVDASGTVSLRGSSNLTILIDGKPANSENSGTGQRLDQLPASRIAQVEVMTNPSARYDAAGAGVINIITKKQVANGTDGQVALVLGTGEKYSPGISLSRRQGAATWKASYDGRDQQFRSRSHSEQTAALPGPGLLRTSQQGTGFERHQNHEASLGLDYTLSPEQTLSLSAAAELERHTELENQNLTQQASEGPLLRQTGRQELNTDVLVLHANADYRRSWAAHPGRELTANAGYVRVAGEVPVTQTLSGAGTLGWKQGQAVQFGVLFAGLDYVHPLADGKSKLETGLKFQHSVNNGSSDMLLPSTTEPTVYTRDAARSVAYDFQELLPAAYATYQRKFNDKWSAQGGLRTEYTNLTGTVRGRQGGVALDYLSFFPSATVARELGKEAGQQKLQLSYARRLNRPSFMQQLPFELYTDPRNYRLGNPGLRAEFSHNLELGHQITLGGGATISTTLFGRFTDNAIQRLRSVDTLASRLSGAGLVTAETYRNFGRTANLGLELTWNQPLTKWWRVAATGSLYRSQVATNGASAANRAALAGTLRLNNNFTLTPKLDVQLTGSFRSNTLTAQGRQLATGGLDVALRQRLFQDRAALTLRVSDALNTQVREFEIDAPGLTARYYDKQETRVGWLGFTWYLGASKPAKRIEAAPQGGGGFGG